ncbi:MAG TPA: hypothetical protein PKJ67_04720, partial [Methanoculleus sp.]|nr:hypothetical protein [Methanoculleus sp.]
LDGGTRRENLEAFAGKGCYLVDMVRRAFRKNRKAAIPADLIRVSARDILAREFKALSPDYVVAKHGACRSPGDRAPRERSS